MNSTYMIARGAHDPARHTQKQQSAFKSLQFLPWQIYAMPKYDVWCCVGTPHDGRAGMAEPFS